MWKVFLEEEWERPSREDFYAAQIALECARNWAKHPGRLKLEHYLLKFVTPKEKQEASMSMKQKTTASKAKWFVATGVDSKIEEG